MTLKVGIMFILSPLIICQMFSVGKAHTCINQVTKLTVHVRALTKP